VQRIAWRYPEWWALLASAVGWLLLAYRAHPWLDGMSHRHLHGDGGAMAMSLPTGRPPDPLASLGTWLVMTVAMMVPLTVASIRTTAARSLWSRRERAIVGFLLGYLGPWLIAGMAVTMLEAGPGHDTFGSPAVAAAGCAVAAAWQITPAKGAALRACHRTKPLAPTGWRADGDCLGYGWMIGGWCIVSCWALMLATVLAGHSLAAMAAASGIALVERVRPRPETRLTCGLLCLAALLYAAAAWT
jgi:predicted metal-binding membrane protein